MGCDASTWWALACAAAYTTFAVSVIAYDAGYRRALAAWRRSTHAREAVSRQDRRMQLPEGQAMQRFEEEEKEKEA